MMRSFLVVLIALGGFVGAAAGSAQAQGKPLAEGARVERNVIYGMYSGLALLLDVHVPAAPNGYGVIFISGSGWQSPLHYGATPLKENQIPIWGPSLLKAGYTVFALNHRAVPRFHYPGAVEDVQRAIRFVRHNAKTWRIDGTRLGGMGGSSGGHLIGLTAMLAAPGIAGDADPVNQQPATLQAIVLRAAPTDLVEMAKSNGVSGVVGFLEAPLSEAAANQQLYRQASPSTHIKAGAPPTLLVHGDADESVPFAQSEALEAKLKAAGVATRLVRVPGGAHGADFVAANRRPDWPDFFGEAVGWYDRHLRSR
jgi:acetyl esterase/lipase